ncbi:MAG: response regulator [Thermodesulfobacteriota bacterium]|nr:response regulator [Thermodesulfobacteriota bacterium]
MENKTILIVEDDELNMKLLKGLLSLDRYHVLEAVNAEIAMDLIQEHKPDLILMDIQLPGIDGLSATQIIKGNPEFKDISIVALTSFAMQGDEEKAFSAGCNGYITKPIETRSFLDQISQFFTNSQIEEKSPNEKGSRPRILIVDDEPRNIKLLSAQIPADKYEIIKAYDGIEALEKTKKALPDLILLDIMMHKMNGYELTSSLKNDPKTAHIPIILITALDDSESRAKGLEAGAEEFLSKPVNSVEIMTRIESMLRLKQYREQLSIRTQSDAHFIVQGDREERRLRGEDHPVVLLVEDNDNDARIIQEYLRGEPYKIEIARNGEDALSIVLRERIDLILLDILLPGMNGFEVCNCLKEDGETEDIQIVLITSLNDLESKIRGLELGADDFLVKPVDSRELGARINVLLKKKAYLDQLHSHYETALNAAITDKLTGLFNHTYFKHVLGLEIKRSQRQRHPVALIMADIDDFKRCNDTLGHLAGDRILEGLGKLIRENIREVDLAARYGGEEFAVLVPYADTEGALHIAERILTITRSYNFLGEATLQPSRVTFSMGIALSPSDASTTEDLIQKADSALYKAKSEGKNRVCVYKQQ